MPRGIPKARSDETAMRYTSFHVPLGLNPKYQANSYMKSDSSSYWTRKNTRRKDKDPTSEFATGTPTRRGYHTIVIHPGSTTIRIGRASDPAPLCIPAIVARRQAQTRENTGGVVGPTYLDAITKPQPKVDPKRNAEVEVDETKGKKEGRTTRRKSAAKKAEAEEAETAAKAAYEVSIDSEDPFDQKLAALQISLRDRMRFYKLAIEPQATQMAAMNNLAHAPELVPDAEDPEYLRVKESLREKQVLVGDDALLLATMPNLTDTYVLRRPIIGKMFNFREYESTSFQVLLADIEALVKYALFERLNVEKPADLKEASAILVIPDFWERPFVREWIQLLLTGLGIGRITVIQESLAATYGAGISSACVVDIGATYTSIACVDDGLVIADTRMQLLMGGNDVTQFLHVLLSRIGFPYRDANLARTSDWEVLDDLKKRICTLNEADVALNSYEFKVRRPGKPTEKYQLRAYDENILAPMCIFEPRVIEFELKRAGLWPATYPDVSEEVVELDSDRKTRAMDISTQHLLSTIYPTTPLEAPALATASTSTANVDALVTGLSADAATPSGSQPAGEASMDIDVEGGTESTAAPPVLPAEPTAPTAAAPTSGPQPAVSTPVPGAVTPVDPQPEFLAPQPEEPAIDIAFEAAKLPLDVAIFNSARAAGGDEKIRKYLQAVLVLGGGSMVPGMAHALESRLQAIATPLVPNMEKVQIMPPPKGVDPGNLVWKGGSVLAKMDAVADLWVSAEDWDVLGMRGLRERCFWI